jgi:hypothetical protein
MTFLITFRAKVMKVEEKRRALRTLKTGEKNAEGKDVHKVEYENMGWFVHLEGSWESLHVGMDKPDLEPGQTMVVTMRSEPQPSEKPHG